MRLLIIISSFWLPVAAFSQFVVTPSIASGFYDIEPPGVTASIDAPLVAGLQAGYQWRAVEPTLGVSYQRLRGTLTTGDVATPLRANDLLLWGGVAVHLPDADLDRESCALVLGAGYLFDPEDFGAGVAAVRGGVDLRIGVISFGLFAQVSYPDATDDLPWLTTLQLGVPLWLSPE